MGKPTSKKGNYISCEDKSMNCLDQSLINHFDHGPTRVVSDDVGQIWAANNERRVMALELMLILSEPADKRDRETIGNLGGSGGLTLGKST